MMYTLITVNTGSLQRRPTGRDKFDRHCRRCCSQSRSLWIALWRCYNRSRRWNVVVRLLRPAAKSESIKQRCDRSICLSVCLSHCLSIPVFHALNSNLHILDLYATERHQEAPCWQSSLPVSMDDNFSCSCECSRQ